MYSLRNLKRSFIAFLFASIGISEASALQCKSFLKDSLKTRILNDLKTHQSLSFEEGNMLLKNLRADEATKSQSSSETYADYMQMRLSLLTPFEQKAFQKVMEKEHSIRVDKDIALTIHPFTQKLFVHLPKNIFNSLSMFTALTHEMEHLIQASKSLKGFTSSELDPRHSSVYMFNAERAAMTAEGVFLMSLPRKLRRAELIDFKKKLKQVSAHDKPEVTQALGFFIDSLQFSLRAQSLKDYVKLNWKNGRYSRASLITHHMKVYPLIAKAYFRREKNTSD